MQTCLSPARRGDDADLTLGALRADAMIERCPNCRTPIIGDECPNCPPRGGWFLFMAFVLSLVVLAGLKHCTSQPEPATVAPMRHLPLVLALCCYPASARAERPIPECAWTPAAKVELGYMVQLESTSSDEYRTFSWALARRWRGRPAVRALTFSSSVTAFSWILRRHRDTGYRGASPRQRWILSHPVPSAVAGELDAWARGERDDGCRRPIWDWHAPPGGNTHCPGNNAWYRMPLGVVLEEGHCG